MTHDELIEAAAKAIYESWDNYPVDLKRSWEEYAEKLPGGAGHFRKHAARAIAAIEPLIRADERAKENEACDEYLVWSNEHNAWWRAKSAGYCTDVVCAGIYTRAEALSISHKCRDRWLPGDSPTELPVPLADLPQWAIDAIRSRMGGE